MAVDQFLEEKISKGGHGNWGSQPMLANDNVYHQQNPAKQADIKEMVKFILDLAK
jgi:cytochrome c551/c552